MIVQPQIQPQIKSSHRHHKSALISSPADDALIKLVKSEIAQEQAKQIAPIPIGRAIVVSPPQ